MKKNIVSVALVVVFVMALAAPAFAQSMTHTIAAEGDGTFDWKMQAGHLCNTGAQQRKTIMGSGALTEKRTVAMVPGRLTVDDETDWVAGATSLTVTSTIELCAPPKYTYEDAVVSTAAMFGDTTQPKYYVGGAFVGENYQDAPTYDLWTPLTKQIWAVQVQADPGYSGNLHQDFEASYGPYAPAGADDEGNPIPGAANAWSTRLLRGPLYVGDYFNIDQFARTSMGTVKRFIDVSSPWSHAYLMEDMSIVGKSEIDEAFAMTNIGPGADVIGLWWDLF